MSSFSSALHTGTPAITTSFRGLVCLRHPDTPDGEIRLLVARTRGEPLMRTSRAFGARMLVGPSGEPVADALTVSGLSGQPLSLHTADGDESLRLTDYAGRPLWSRNAQGTVTALTYEAAAEGGRPLSVSEVAAGSSGRVREMFTYQPLDSAEEKARNRAGGLLAHRDNAGLSRTQAFSLTGQPLMSEQRLLTPSVTEPDWATLTEVDTDATLVVSGTYDATGSPLTATNAAEVTTVTAFDVSGAVRETRLRYIEHRAGKEVVTRKDILRRADGVVLSQTAGNGITDEYEYDPRKQLLTRHLTQRPAGHPLGALLISDLHYTYDPAGNILTLEDLGAAPAWHGNGVTSGLRTYEYDSLYRLTSATGRERTASGHYSTRSPVLTDGTAGSIWAAYREDYTYDNGNNLTVIAHTGGSGDRTVTLTVATGSNRAVTQGCGTTPEDCFLTGGLQKALSDGRELRWHADGQLRRVSPVTRTEGKTDDTERYHYADGGTRVRKLRTTLNSGGTQTMTTTYAGGAETRQRRMAGTLQLDVVITEGDGVRLVHNRITGEVHLRYSFSDHLGSCGGETDEQGNISVREEYLPFGASAGSDEETTEVTDRTRRYSSKERDATGLLYYGWRYYQPEAGRWLSADPGGLVDGVNLFRFVRNNPLNMIDTVGQMPFPCIAGRGTQQVALVYGMDDGQKGAGREDYIERTHTKKNIKITINEINSALGIEGSALNAGMNRVLTKIESGIVVNDTHVDKLIKSLPDLKKDSAYQILSGWSSYISAHASFLRPGRKIIEADDALRMGIAEGLMKKNLGGGEIGSDGARSLRHVLARYVGSLGQGGADDGSIPEEGLSQEQKIHRQKLKSAFVMNFFRKTSKLGIDWALNEGTPLNYVEFLSYGRNRKGEVIGNVRGVMSQSKAEAHSQHTDSDLSMAGSVAYPITLSELRHVQKKRYQEHPNFRWIRR
ncbi:RHS repeat domain-containing protein [Enterobacter chuandaensis]